MRRLLLLILLVPSCSREPVAVADGGVSRADSLPVPDRSLPPDDYLLHDLGLPEGLRPPTPPGGCAPGDRQWCDGLMYDGWGQVACDPATGTWRRKLGANGKSELDCQELATGERPNTVCACYHFFFNPSCCERPDCVLHAGESGALCPPSKGALCDYCNPQKSECKEAGAKCIVTNQHETFCGRLCSPSEPCPAGYQCMVVKLQASTTNQCVPNDFSCYN